MVDVYVAGKSKKKKKHSSGGKKRERKSVRDIKKIIGSNGSENLFTSFATFPKKVYMEAQEDGEEVVLFLRQHMIVNANWALLVLVLVFVPSFFEFFPPYSVLPTAYRFVVMIAWYLLLFGFALSKFMHWFFNIFVLTDERLIDVDFENLFYRVISDAKIDKVQDVNSVMSGAWQTFFNYGHVFIQTASDKPQFVFQNIPHPDLAVKYINVLIDQEEQEKIEGRVK